MGLVVQSNGEVQACGCESSINAPALIVGDIRQQTLSEIWNGPRMRALRESFTNGTLNPNCLRCDYYYQKPDFHMPDMRRLAKTTRRRLAGEAVRHREPIAEPWCLE
jgi:radical SAM protein with 4Fe4S-binding SPASM domain